MTLEKEREVAIDAVKSAMIICRKVRATYSEDDSQTKDDLSPVTVADYASQAKIIAALAQAFPDDPVVGEEDASELRDPAQSGLLERIAGLLEQTGDTVCATIDRGGYSGGARGRFWTLDPIDGTKGYIRGGQYAVALALIEDGEVVLGVLGCPNMTLGTTGKTGCIFAAVVGQGAFEIDPSSGSERRIQTQGHTDFTEANFCESVESGHSSHGESEQIAARLGISAPPFRIDSQCKYAAVARGQATIYLRLPTRADYVEKIWDHAAGVAVITEAGGQVSDIHGNALDFSRGRRLEDNKGVVVTNGLLHADTVEAVQAVLS